MRMMVAPSWPLTPCLWLLRQLNPGIQNPFPWLAETMDIKKEANFFEQRATEYSKGATRGDWNTVWSSFDKRQSAKAANEEETTDDGPGLFGDEAGEGAVAAE